MEIDVKSVDDMAGHDTGGGCRIVKAEIFIDKTRHPREQRRALIYETLAACLAPLVAHRQIEDITGYLGDAFDQYYPLED